MRERELEEGAQNEFCSMRRRRRGRREVTREREREGGKEGAQTDFAT